MQVSAAACLVTFTDCQEPLAKIPAFQVKFLRRNASMQSSYCILPYSSSLSPHRKACCQKQRHTFDRVQRISYWKEASDSTNRDHGRTRARRYHMQGRLNRLQACTLIRKLCNFILFCWRTPLCLAAITSCTAFKLYSKAYLIPG